MQFELSVVGSLWKRWADANDLYDLDPRHPSIFSLRISSLPRWHYAEDEH